MSNTIFTDEPVASPQLGPWRYWPLRLVLFSLVLTGVYLGCRLLPVLAKPYLSCLPFDVRSILFAVLGIAILIALYRQLVRWTEKCAAAELSATGVFPSLLGGAAIGCVLFCALIAVLVAYGAASFKGIGGYDAVIKAAAASLIAAMGEEIAFRGGVYRVLEEGFGSLLAIAFTGAPFALLHASQSRSDGRKHASHHAGIRNPLGRRLCVDALAVVSNRIAFRLEFHRRRNFRCLGVRRQKSRTAREFFRWARLAGRRKVQTGSIRSRCHYLPHHVSAPVGAGDATSRVEATALSFRHGLREFHHRVARDGRNRRMQVKHLPFLMQTGI
jgi:membrane protease YdiL (CAAX protease family)